MRNRVVKGPQDARSMNVVKPKVNTHIRALRNAPALALDFAESEQVLAGSPASEVRPEPGVTFLGVHLKVGGEADSEAECVGQGRHWARRERQHVLRSRHDLDRRGCGIHAHTISMISTSLSGGRADMAGSGGNDRETLGNQDQLGVIATSDGFTFAKPSQ